MIVEIRVVTNASKEEVVQESNYLKVKVKAKPNGGEANKAVVKLLARQFNVGESNVKIIRGLKSRKKMVEII